jgi:hypothetical protein
VGTGAVTVRERLLLPVPPETTEAVTVRVPDLFGVRERLSVTTELAGTVRLLELLTPSTEADQVTVPLAPPEL